MPSEEEFSRLKSAVLALAVSVTEVRMVVYTISQQPNLLLSPDDRSGIAENLKASLESMDTVLQLFDELNNPKR
jgi:hypothetical protein